jgi:hypothetical protein
VVRDEVLKAVTTALEGPVRVIPERRGFEHRRGVPDSVFWLTPADSRFTCKPLPVLIELEGSFANAVDDFAKFANRYDKQEEYQYSVQAPIIGDLGTERTLERMQYDIIGIRANLLTDQNEINEGRMHEEFSSWFKIFQTNINTAASIKHHLSQTVVEWHLSFTMFGHEFATKIPFILSGSNAVNGDIIARVGCPTLPGVVVVNNKHDSRDHTDLYHNTAVEFPTFHPIRFRGSGW